MFPFAMINEHVTIIVLSCLVAVAGVALIASLRSKLAAARKEWLELSSLLSAYSLPHCAKILEDLAVDDVPGAIRECEYLLRLMRNPKQAAAALDAVFTAQLPIALSDPSRIAGVSAVIRAWIAGNPAAATSAGLATGPVAVSAAAGATSAK